MEQKRTPMTMMNHKLRMLILKQLTLAPKAGYGLIKDIHKATGWTPSYGSVYPELDRLRKEGLLEAEMVGRKKVYHLTVSGKEVAKGLKRGSKEAMEQVDRLHKTVMHICGIKDWLPLEEMMRRLASPDPDMKRIMRKSYGLKLQFARLLRGDAYKRRNKEICGLIDGLTDELRLIK